MTLPAGWRLAPPITMTQAAGHAYNAKFTGEGGATILAIAMAESSLIPNQRNVNRDGSIDRGILQINTVHGQVTDAMADDPAQAFAFGWELSRGGTKFTDWTVYKNGAYAKHIGAARTAMQQVQAAGGVPTASTAIAEPLSVANGGLSQDIGGSRFAPLPQTLDQLPPMPLDAALINVQGIKVDRLIPLRYLTAARLDLSVDEASQLALTIADASGAWKAGAFFLIGTDLDLGELRFRVTGLDNGPSTGALDELAVTALSAPVEDLRMADPGGQATTFPGPIAANELLYDLTQKVGLRLVSEAGVRYPSITLDGKADTEDGAATSRKRAVSPWELGLDYARREGKWMFEAGGVLYYGRPTFLLARLTQIVIRYGVPAGPGYLTPLEAPAAGRAVDDDQPNRGSGPRTITFQLPRGLADRIRPGMAIAYDGTPGWSTRGFTGYATAPAGYLVTRVTIDLLDPGAAVAVEAREAVDPDPEPVEGDPAVTASTAVRTGPPDGRAGTGPPALDLVTICLKQVGDRYVYGVETDPRDPDPDAFDCSELIQWGCARMGVTFVDGSGAQIDAITQAGRARTVEQAKTIRGALLWHPGHVALSLGDGVHTVEAMGRKYGVVEGPIGSRFTRAGLIPGLNYGTA